MKTPPALSHHQFGKVAVSYLHSAICDEDLARELSPMSNRIRDMHWRHVLVISRAAAEGTNDARAMIQAWMYGIAVRNVRTGRVGFVTTLPQEVERLNRLLPVVENSRVTACIFGSTPEALRWVRMLPYMQRQSVVHHPRPLPPRVSRSQTRWSLNYPLRPRNRWRLPDGSW